VDRQNADPESQLALTRRLIALRQARPALRLGALTPVPAPAPILAFERAYDGERLLCVFNLGERACDWGPRYAGGWRLEDAVNGAEIARLPPLSGLIARAI